MRARKRFEPVVARMMQMIGLGGGEQDAVDARAEQRADEIVLRPVRNEARIAGERALRDRSRRPGPALNAASASTSTIWRSSRAK